MSRTTKQAAPLSIRAALHSRRMIRREGLAETLWQIAQHERHRPLRAIRWALAAVVVAWLA